MLSSLLSHATHTTLIIGIAIAGMRIPPRVSPQHGSDDAVVREPVFIVKKLFSPPFAENHRSTGGGSGETRERIHNNSRMLQISFSFYFVFFLFDFSFVHSLSHSPSRWDGILFERRCERNKLLSSDFFKCIIIRCIVELDTQWQQQQNDGYKNIYYKQRVRYSLTIPLKCPYCSLALCVSVSHRIISVRAERVYLGWQNWENFKQRLHKTPKALQKYSLLPLLAVVGYCQRQAVCRLFVSRVFSSFLSQLCFSESL